MSKIPVISGRKMVKILESIGFVVVSQKGSHIKLKRVTKNYKETVIVPNHKEIRRGTLRNILKIAGILIEDLENFK